MKLIARCGLSLSLLFGVLCLSGCGQSDAKKEADEASKWHSGGPSKSYSDQINAQRAATAKPAPPTSTSTAPPTAGH